MAEAAQSHWFKEFLRDYVLWTGGDQVVYNKRVRGLVQTGLGSVVSWIIQHTVFPHVPILTEGLLVAAVALGFITIWWAITALASKYLSRGHPQKPIPTTPQKEVSPETLDALRATASVL